jgi:hybrid cluster-associated redox disulfide protein
MTATKEMSIAEVLKMDRGTASVFVEHGMHCLGCPHATAESLEEAGMAHGIDVDVLVDNLNAFLAANGK